MGEFYIMVKQSAGILMYRNHGGRREVFLVHPGGPFWSKRDLTAWSIPKGEFAQDEDPLTAAKREFTEETGYAVEGDFIDLGNIRQPSGKRVRAWAIRGDCDAAAIKSNTFTMEWPPRSGQIREFPEVDRAAWFDLTTAREKLHKGQVPLLDAFSRKLGEN